MPGAKVNRVGGAFVHVAHRIVRNGREIHHCVHTGQHVGVDAANVDEVLRVEFAFRQRRSAGKAVREEADIRADQTCGGIMLAQSPHHGRPDITHVADYEYPHH